MNLQIHPMTIADYDHVLALWQQCDDVGLSAADSRDNIAAYLIRNPNMSFIAKSDGSLIGAVLCGHDGRRGYLHHLAVHPTARYPQPTSTGPSMPGAAQWPQDK